MHLKNLQEMSIQYFERNNSIIIIKSEDDIRNMFLNMDRTQ